MKIGILINEGPYNHQASDTAYLFARAALARGHLIPRVFFYGDGVYNAGVYANPPRDDRQILKRWTKLAREQEIDLVVCVAAGIRRGITGEVLAPGFRIAGLGQLIDAGMHCDRLVTFGD